MKGKPIIYVPVNPENDARARVQRECVDELILHGWKRQGPVYLTDPARVRVCVEVMEAPE